MDEVMKAIREAAYYTVSETPCGDVINIGFHEEQIREALKRYKGAKVGEE